MSAFQVARARQSPRLGKVSAVIVCCIIGLLPLAYADGAQNAGPPKTSDNPLNEFPHSTLIRLNTAALAHAVRAGREIQLPFGRPGGEVVKRKVQLTLRNLRSADLTEFVLKDGVAGSGSSVPLPPPATYQGKVRDGGVAVFTITEAAIEGSMLVAPDGWSFIEPLEPLLRLRNVEPAQRERLLKKFNHVVYNTSDLLGSVSLNDDLGGLPTAVSSVNPHLPLVMSIVADGDAGLFRAYPLDSVMPFWLKQETLLNAIDWLYNCVEPDANADNAYANCGNDFDGGSNGFQARVRIDRLEVWTAGGPDASTRNAVLRQSISMTHQASPLCCGPPHTAGLSSLVHFFSGKGFEDGAGEAAGIGGLNYDGDHCFDTTLEFKCNHAVSQLVPSPVSQYTFHGNAFEQQALVAHEIGHNNNAKEFFSASPVCWLFNEVCGMSLMESNTGFTDRTLYLYDTQDAQVLMGPLLAEQLETAPSNP